MPNVQRALGRVFLFGAAVALLSNPVWAAEMINPSVSTAAESSRVIRTTSSFLRSVYVTTGAAAGYLLAYNLDAVPVDGAVTPRVCISVPAITSISADFGEKGMPFPEGLVVAFSTTGCFTQTLSATAFFSVMAQ